MLACTCSQLSAAGKPTGRGTRDPQNLARAFAGGCPLRVCGARVRQKCLGVGVTLTGGAEEHFCLPFSLHFTKFFLNGLDFVTEDRGAAVTQRTMSGARPPQLPLSFPSSA